METPGRFRPITAADLARWRACPPDRDRFVAHFPDGMAVTWVNVQILADANVDIVFGALHLLHEAEGYAALQAATLAIMAGLVEQLLVAFPDLDAAGAPGLATDLGALRGAFESGLLARVEGPTLAVVSGLPPAPWFTERASESDAWIGTLRWVANAAASFGKPTQLINAVAAVIHHADIAITGMEPESPSSRPTQVAWGHLLRTRLGIG